MFKSYPKHTHTHIPEEPLKRKKVHIFMDQYRACKQMEALYPVTPLCAKYIGPAFSYIQDSIFSSKHINEIN